MEKTGKVVVMVFTIALFMLFFTSCHKNEGASNPYIESKTKPTQQIKDEYNKSMKKQNRAAKKQMKRTRKQLYGK